MGAELGRISGPLLAANLLRNQVDLGFENNLVYFKVSGAFKNVGVKTDAPSSDLTINGTIKSDYLLTNSGGTYNLGNFTLYNNTIQHLSGKIFVSPNQSSDPAVKITGVIQTPTLEINDNNFTAIGTDSNISFSTTGTGKFTTNKDVNVQGNLHATGNITLDGNMIFGNEVTDTITFDAEVTSNINPKKIEGGTLITESGDPLITENGVEYLSDNVNLPSFDLGSNSKQWASINLNTVTFVKSAFNDVELYQNSIYSRNVNQDLVLDPNGTGSVVVQNLKFSGNTISNVLISPVNNDQRSIIFKPSGIGILDIDATSAIQLPVGPTGALQQRGQIRFNSTKNRFRGYVPDNQTISLTQLYDVAENSYITPELTENAGDNTFRFVLNNTIRATLSTTSLNSTRYDLGNIVFENNIISGLVSDFKFNPTTNTVLGDIFINQNELGALTTQPLTFINTDRGYVKFSGNKGIVLPFGTSAERPLNPENGQYRYNTDISNPLDPEPLPIGGEVWSSEQNQWIPMGGGGSGSVNEAEAFTGMTIWALTFNL